jgi:hypothetical protein
MTIAALVQPVPTRLGFGDNYVQIAADGTLTLQGDATTYDDLLRDATSARAGNVAPTVGAGFRGDANHLFTTFVHTQADEVQFEIQLPHRGKAGSRLYPHVHFTPTTTGTGTVKFILELYAANVNAQFPSSPSTHQMTKTWAVNQQWYHLIADNDTGLDLGSWELSNVWHVRLYRDNTVDGNYAAAVGFLYFDIHVEIDSLGSDEEYVK